MKRDTDRRYWRGHVYFYVQKYGPVPDGLVLDHLCRQRDCVNPDHVEPVTHIENCRRGASTKLTLADVEQIRASSETQALLAARFGVGQAQISRIRTGKRWPTTLV